MARKVCTKQEAIRIGYYLAGREGWEKDDVQTVRNKDVWDGKWHDTTFYIQTSSWSIYASRIKHQDGRIWNPISLVDRELDFALWCLDHLPAAHPGRKLIAERIVEPANLTFSLTSAEEKRRARNLLKERGGALSVEDARKIIEAARSGIDPDATILQNRLRNTVVAQPQSDVGVANPQVAL